MGPPPGPGAVVCANTDHPRTARGTGVPGTPKWPGKRESRSRLPVATDRGIHGPQDG